MASLNKKNRYLSYDVIRVVALVFSILCHIGTYFIMTYNNPETIEFITGNIFAQSSASIPLFIMLTGALFLREEKNFILNKFLKKSWLPLVILTIVWTFFYAALYGYILPILTHTATSYETFISYLLTFNGSYYPHMWYSRMIIGLYLLIPVLRLFVKKENKNYIKWIIIGCIIVQYIPATLEMFTTQYYTTLITFMDTFYMMPLQGYVAYFLLGWYLTTFPLSKKNRYILYALGLTALLIAILAPQYYSTQIPGIRFYVHSGLDIVSLTWGVSVFAFLLALFKDRTNTNKKSIQFSNFVYGMYIAHVLFLEIFVQLVASYPAFPVHMPIVYIITVFVFTVTCSYILVWIVSKTRIKMIFYLK
ncbi:MAG: acyltransferase [Methanosphaera sp.]|nr:acyltransferase [Methanosphaera sp.]